MGWNRGTDVFDPVAKAILGLNMSYIRKEYVIEVLINALEELDWDTPDESEWIDHPLVQRVMLRLHPDWKEE